VLHLTGHNAVTTRFKRKRLAVKQAKAAKAKAAKEEAKAAKAKAKASKNAKTVHTPNAKPRRSPASPASPKQRASAAVGTKSKDAAHRNRVYSAGYHKTRTTALKNGATPESARAQALHVVQHAGVSPGQSPCINNQSQ
jgi:hypothetical protein